GEADLVVQAGRWFLPLAGPAACPVLARDPWLAGAGGAWPWGCGDRVWAGQAAQAGGPVAASNRFIHSASWCQPSGRCSVMWPRPWRATRAATSIRSARGGAPRGLAEPRAARAPAGPQRVWVIAARGGPAPL